MSFLQKTITWLGFGQAMSTENGADFETNRITVAAYSDWMERAGGNYALGLSATWACVNLLAGTIASLPLMVYRTGSDGQRQVDKAHPLYRVLHDSPNTDQTAINFWEFVCASLELRGNAYAEKVLGVGGNVSALLPMRPEDVAVRRTASGALEYELSENGRRRVLPQERVLHVRGVGGNPLGGLSPLSACRGTFGTALSTEEAAGQMFANGARPSGVLSTEKALTPEQRQMAERLLQGKFSGALNAGRPMLLDNGVKWEQLSLNPEDSQMLESRRFSIEEICRVFGVPPHMIGHTEKSTSWGTGLEQQTLAFQKFSLRPRLKRIEEALKQQLLTPRDRADGVTIEFNLEGLLRADSKARADFYNAGLEHGWLVINEVRALENLPPVEGGDVPRMQMQNVPITEAGQSPALPPPDDGQAAALYELSRKLDVLTAKAPSPPPVINVRMPEIKTPPAPNVTVSAEIKGGKVTKTVKRDDRGLIESWTEEES